MGDTNPYAGQAEYWGGEAGRNWVAQEEIYDGMHQDLADRLVSRLAPTAGERILDVGAGTGTISLAVGRTVGRTGHVTALDVSPPMLGRTAERISDAGLGGVISVLQADAQTHAFDGSRYDAVTSRFGVMFFDDPIAAFANIGSATRPGGRLAVAAWQSFDQNEFMALPHAVVARHVEDRPDPMATGNPFSLGDREVVEEMLDRSGWIDVELEAITSTQLSGGPATVDQAVDFALGRGHVAATLRGASEVDRATVRADLHDEFAARHDGQGVRLHYAAWIITAERP